MKRLPIYEIEDRIVSTLKTAGRLVLQAPTGSGKSTQVPQMLLQHGLLGDGRAVILQPRRLAARLLASRVAQEMNVQLGREVGYQVRFENATSAATRIIFETEGILLRQMIQDPSLPGIRALIFDEFHERHLYGDITLARALDIQESTRPDLLLIVMSATLDSGALEKYLAPCSVLSSEGRMFPVSIEYLPDGLDQLRLPSGNSPPTPSPIMPTAPATCSSSCPADTRSTARSKLSAIARNPGAVFYFLFTVNSRQKDQDAAVANYEKPKIVVATNVAETSITIDGVRLVIDGGLARIPRYDPNRGINTLLVERISQASAEQRAGRAGRTAPGQCIRLWSKSEHDERPARELPEIRRLDLSEVVLTLKASGVEDLRKFRWLEAPNDAALQHAEELLLDLGALAVRPETPNSLTMITDLGRRMLAFPLHPRYSRMLLAAQEYGCVYDACLVAALTQGRDLLLRKPDKQVTEAREDLFGTLDKATLSDFQVLMRAWEYANNNHFKMDALQAAGVHGVTARQVGPLHEQFLRIAKQQGLDADANPVGEEALRKCILIGFSDRVARRIDEGQSRCDLVHGRRGTLARESVVRHSPLMVVAEIQEIGGKPGDVNTVLSLATAIEIDWLRQFFPGDLRAETRVTFDSVTNRVRAEDTLRFRDLVVSSRRVETPPPDAAARLLADEVVAGRLQLQKWDHSVVQWIQRLNVLAQWCPDLELPQIHEEERRHIIEQLCHGGISFKDIKDREVKPVVQSWISGAQRDLVDKHMPERITLSNGRTPKVTYEAENPPFISLRIQELFGVTQTPRIAMGRVPLSVHILAPSMRPVQVTQDLANFWREHYPRIKSELQRRYPKHEWR